MLTVDLIVRELCYHLALQLHKPVLETQYKVVRGGGCSGKVSVVLPKAADGVQWQELGRPLLGHESLQVLEKRQRVYHGCRLVDKRDITHDCKLLTLRCPTHLYLPVPSGYHVFLRLHGGVLCKPYTPVPVRLDVTEWQHSEGRPGNALHFLVKVYPDGDMSTALDGVTVGADESDPDGGDTGSVLEVTLAEGEPVAGVCGEAGSDDPPVTDVALLAAGTGITPMLGAMLTSLASGRHVRLLMFNKTEADIPWREELDDLQDRHEQLLKVHHVLSAAGSSWRGLRGRVSHDLLESLLPVGDGGRNVWLGACGPRGFTDSALRIFGELGYMAEEYHAFLG